MIRIAVVHGRLGSGKSTHSGRFKESFPGQVEHLSVGNRLRAILCGDSDSVFSKEVRQQAKLLEQSLPLDFSVVNGVVFEYVNALLKEIPSLTHVILDGFPSALGQLPLFFQSIQKDRHTFVGSLELTLSEPTALLRVLQRGQRSGEDEITKQMVRDRYHRYEEQTAPTLSALKTCAPLIQVDAEPDLDIVWFNFNTAMLLLTGLSQVSE